MTVIDIACLSAICDMEQCELCRVARSGAVGTLESFQCFVGEITMAELRLASDEILRAAAGRVAPGETRRAASQCRVLL